jgi:hypothetical protein
LALPFVEPWLDRLTNQEKCMKRQLTSADKRGQQSPSITTQIRGCEKPRIRYAVGRMILDQHGEHVIGFRTQSAFVWADSEVANRYADSANDPKFRYIRA